MECDHRVKESQRLQQEEQQRALRIQEEMRAELEAEKSRMRVQQLEYDRLVEVAKEEAAARAKAEVLTSVPPPPTHTYSLSFTVISNRTFSAPLSTYILHHYCCIGPERHY